MSSKIVFSAAILAGSAVAFAGPTSLIFMPIADILGNREAVFQFATLGNERNVDKAHYFDQGLTIGVNDIAEIGFDNDLLGHTTLNWKAQLYTTKDPSKFALSVGMQNIALVHGGSDKYVVGRYDTKAFRLHAGYLYNDRGRLMLGADGPLWKGLSWSTDYISGPGCRVWTSLNVPLPVRGFLLSLAGGIAADHKDGIQHMATLYYSFKL